MKRPAGKNKKRRQTRRTTKLHPEPMGTFSLIEHRMDGRKSVEFQQMKGKILETITLDTTPEYHSIDLDFADGTGLALRLEPCFSLHATYSDPEKGDQEIGEDWLPVHSATNPR
jgi:hypothetical protein